MPVTTPAFLRHTVLSGLNVCTLSLSSAQPHPYSLGPFCAKENIYSGSPSRSQCPNQSHCGHIIDVDLSTRSTFHCLSREKLTQFDRLSFASFNCARPRTSGQSLHPFTSADKAVLSFLVPANYTHEKFNLPVNILFYLFA